MKKTPNIASWILFISYLGIGFIPNWQAVDKIAPQWLAMNIINLFSVGYLIYKRESYNDAFRYLTSSKIAYVYFGFLLWAALSYFYSINRTEQLVNISRQFNVFVMFGSMLVLLSYHKNRFSNFAWIFTIILGIEIFFVLVQAQEMIATNGVISPGALKGITANRNITAFSLAIKIPFVYYLITVNKKQFIKALLSLLLFSVFFGLLMIQSRASFLATAFGIIAFMFLIVFLKYRKQQNKRIQLKFEPLIYTASALLMSILINQTFLKSKGSDALSRAATIGQITTDDSITARIRYYTDVVDQMISSPIFGVGLGNWKLKSIDYDKYDIKGYVVPYHAHSDFIQLGAELGILGFLAYLSIFFLTTYYGLKLFFNSKEELEKRIFIFLLVVALGVYSVDSSLNFPIARPQVLIVWTFILAIISLHTTKLKKQKLKTIYFQIPILLLSIPTLYINNSVYKSLKGQMFLLQDFNSNQFNVPLNQVDQIVPDIPNITVTTIPINSVKARYYVNAKKYDKALALLEEGTKANPYLYYSEILKSQIFQEKGMLDSAKVYARKAFFGLPNNDLHAARYLNLINITRDREALEEAFDLLTYKNMLNNWKNYLIIASGLYPPKDKILVEKAKQAVELFPNNQEFKALYNQIAVGQVGVNTASAYSAKGLEYYNAQDYSKAAIEFEKALEANPLDYAHFENAATANYLIGNLEKALAQINIVVNELNPLNGKCEYIKALIFIRMGDTNGACPLLATSRDSGFSQAEATFTQYCK